MYQRKFRMELSSSTFSDPVEESLTNCFSQFMDCVEHSLWKKYLDKYPEAKDIDLINHYLEFHLDCEELKALDEIDVPPRVVVELLDNILTSKINELLLVPIQQLEEKPESEIPSVTFQEYLDTVKKVDLDLYVIGISLETELEVQPEFEKKPLYFVLYRLRSNLLYSIDDRMYSMKYIEKSMDNFKREFEKILLDQVLYNNIALLTDEHIQHISIDCQNTLIHSFSSELRSGRTLEAGNEIYKEVSQKIRETVELGNITDEYRKRLKHLIKEGLNETKLRSWAYSYWVDFYEYVSSIVKPNHDINHIEKQLFQFVHQAIVRALLEHGNHEEILKTAYNNLYAERTEDLFKWMSEEWLKFVNYTVCLRVKNLTASEFSRLSLKDVEFKSRELFESWQYELPIQKNANVL